VARDTLVRDLDLFANQVHTAIGGRADFDVREVAAHLEEIIRGKFGARARKCPVVGDCGFAPVVAARIYRDRTRGFVDKSHARRPGEVVEMDRAALCGGEQFDRVAARGGAEHISRNPGWPLDGDRAS